MRWGSAARSSRADDGTPDETIQELADVPATVVCAVCGRPDCAGCQPVDEPTAGSGVLAIVPWERPGPSLLSRWWSTAKLATLHHRTFFSALPDGDPLFALAFSAISELVAVAGLVLTAFLMVLPFIPALPRLMLSDPVVRSWLGASLAWGVPGLAAVMMVLHALHGVLTDWAARREGSRRRGRGLRFGFYGCAWDVITLPAGLVAVALSDGPRAALRALPLGLTAPGQAVRSYLAGVHGLSPERAQRAARTAARLTGALLLVAALCATAVVLCLR